MPLKPEDVTTALDIDLSKYDDVKTFSEDFGKAWIRSENVPDIDAYKGKVNNVFRGGIKKVAKEYELDIEIPEKGDPIDLVPEIAKRVAGKYEARIADYEAKLKDASKGGAAKEWEEKYGKLETKYKETEGLLNGLNTQYEGLKTSIAQEKESAWIDSQWDNSASKIDWIQDTSDYTKRGFLADQKAKYRITKDDKGVPVATDADGHRIPDPSKPAKFMSLEEIITANAKAAKLWKVHERGGQPINTRVLRTEAPVAGGEAAPIHRVHPAAARR